jgi:hypothetical protein
MEMLTGLFIVALYKATEKIWEKGFDAAWAPVGEDLKEHFLRWAGKGKAREREAAFVRAAETARNLTLRQAPDPQQAERILVALDSERDRKGAEALAEEAAKLMLFSATPDVHRLTRLCQERLQWDALWAGEAGQAPPSADTVAGVLSDFLIYLREALLDQEPYHDLVQREMLRALRQVVAELRPVSYDDEAVYRAQLAAMVRELEFVGIPELKERRPITVEDIFIHLRAEREVEVERPPHLRPDAQNMVPGEPWQEAIEEAVLVPRTAPQPIARERVSITQALKGDRQMVVLGDPGTGKTTLLKYLTVICAEERAEAELDLKVGDGGSPLPVFIPLREFAAECAGRGQDYSLLDYFYTHAREHLLLNLPRGFFEEALDAGRGLVCLDGLDEVWAVGGRKIVRDAVKALVARFPRSHYLVTSRIVGYKEAPLDRRDFVHHTVLPLEDDDIRQFVHKWYAIRERDPAQRKKQADDLIATLEREPRIQTLARNPLLLTIIILVHRIEAELPHERVKLYDKCVAALVDTWEEVKGLTIEEKGRPFYRYRRRLLERLAYELHTRAGEPGRLQTVKEGDLELTLARFLMENRRLGLGDDADGARDEARAFIRLARGRTGLLVERGEGTFGFPHLTFQEYLAACDIENRCMPYGVSAVWEQIKDHLHNPHWREVILLAMGSLNRYEDAPTLLVENILEAGKNDKFEPVLHRHLYLAARVLADRVDVADDLHRQVVDALLEITRAMPRWEQADAFTALSWLDEDNYAVDGLLALAHDPRVDAGVRSAAASALGQLGRAEEAAEILLALARDQGRAAGVRRAAPSALGQLGRAEEKVLDGLLALARDQGMDTGVRNAAASALGQLGRAEEKVLDGLLALARDPGVDVWVRRTAASALGQLGHAGEAAEILLALARDQGRAAGVRSAAAFALGQLGRAEEKVLDGLLALARDQGAAAGVRRDAASALGQLGRAEEAAEILLALARDQGMAAWMRSDAASALGQLGHAGEAAEILLTLARDPGVDPWVRSAAASALGQLGRAEEKVLDGLLALARDQGVAAGVRSTAASVLGQLSRAGEAAEILLALARDPGMAAGVRSAATSALGQLGRAEEKVLDGLLALARDQGEDAWRRSDAASALGQLGRAEEKVLDGLLALARDQGVAARVRRTAYEGIKRLVGNAVD